MVAKWRSKVLQNAPLWPALSDNWSRKPIFGLFESSHFTQVLLKLQGNVVVRGEILINKASWLEYQYVSREATNFKWYHQNMLVPIKMGCFPVFHKDGMMYIFDLKHVLLAHLCRRLRGELLVYQWLHRPSVRQHFKTSSPEKPLGQLNSNFIWRLLRMGERKFVQMVLVTWPRWPPCPYMVKTL